MLLSAEYRIKYSGHTDEDLIATIAFDQNQKRNTLMMLFNTSFIGA